MPADQMFVLVLVLGIVLGLGWLSMNSHRRAGVARQRQAEAIAAAESPAVEVREPERPEGRQRRNR